MFFFLIYFHTVWCNQISNTLISSQHFQFRDFDCANQNTKHTVSFMLRVKMLHRHCIRQSIHFCWSVHFECWLRLSVPLTDSFCENKPFLKVTNEEKPSDVLIPIVDTFWSGNTVGLINFNLFVCKKINEFETWAATVKELCDNLRCKINVPWIGAYNTTEIQLK